MSNPSIDSLPDGWLVLLPHQLVKAEWNYKGEDEEKQRKLTNNIKRNGVVVNLVVRELVGQTTADELQIYEVLDGNHRLGSVIDAGIERVVCFNYGDIPLAAAQRIAIEINETRFPTDHAKMAEMLSGLVDEFGEDDLLETLPMSDKDLEGYADLLDWDWDDEDDTLGAGDGDGEDGPGNFKQIEAALPHEAYDVYDTAFHRVRQELEQDGHGLHYNDELAHGQVIEMLSASFLAIEGASLQ